MTIKQHGGVFGRNPAFNNVSVETLSIAGTALSSTASELNILDGVTADATEINYLDGASTAAVVASKAVLANASGNVALPSGKGIDFSATGSGPNATSELFADYEEGTWTQATSGGSILNLSNISFDTADYRKVGDVVFAFISGNFDIGTANARSIMYATLPIARSGTIFGTVGVRGPANAYEINVGRVVAGNGTTDCVIEFEPDRLTNGDRCGFKGLIVYTA